MSNSRVTMERQVVPWKDWSCMERHQARRWCGSEQDSTTLPLPSLPSDACQKSPHTYLSILFLQVNGRIMKKRIHVRVEHVKPSRCREDFLARRQKNETMKSEIIKNFELDLSKIFE